MFACGICPSHGWDELMNQAKFKQQVQPRLLSQGNVVALEQPMLFVGRGPDFAKSLEDLHEIHDWE